jgi:septum site-determining protein MinD
VALDGKTRAGEAYHNIARRLNGEKVPFLNLDEKEGIFHKLARMIRPGGN